MTEINGFDMNVYDDRGIANGDPVIVHTDRAITLGTGFHNYDDLRDQLKWAVQTGESTRDIPPEAAREIEQTTAGDTRIDVFVVGATIKLEQ